MHSSPILEDHTVQAQAPYDSTPTLAHRPVPPRPPPRHRATMASGLDAPGAAAGFVSHTNLTQMNPNPPPLPTRRNTQGVPPPPPERIPHRHISVEEDGHVASPPDDLVSPPNATEHNRVLSRLPPPPTRKLAPGDKLPPARRNTSESSDESDAPDDEKSRAADGMPDTSRASRRAPVLVAHSHSESHIHVPAHVGCVIQAAHVVVVGNGHQLKVFDLSISEMPIRVIKGEDVNYSRELKPSALQWRGTSDDEERGRYLWIGTKEGHLFEWDVLRGCCTGQRLAIHAGQTILKIMRCGLAMVSVDEAGKVIVWVPAREGMEGINYMDTFKIFRIPEKSTWFDIFDARLWTATREPKGESAGRGPPIKCYSLFDKEDKIGRTLLTSEHTASVLCASMLPSKPDTIFLGHEGGFVSIWSLALDADRTPKCVEVKKIWPSDVLCMKGVGDRLWMAGRKGTVNCYDVGETDGEQDSEQNVRRPWVLTNQWVACGKVEKGKEGTPVTGLEVDMVGLEKLGRLCVMSWGRDEKVRFWDGLLGADWIGTLLSICLFDERFANIWNTDNELIKRESSFSTYRSLNVLIVSWNVDAAKPDALNQPGSSPANISFLSDVLSTVDSPDIIAFGFQELIDLESRKMAAKSVFLGGGLGKSSDDHNKGGDDSPISDKVSSSYKRWHERLVLAVRLAMPPDAPYTVIHTESLVGLFSCIFVKNAERVSLREVATATVKRGMGGRYGNKVSLFLHFLMP